MYAVFLKYLEKCLLCLLSIGPCCVSWFDPLSESCFLFWSGYLPGSEGEVCSLAGDQYAFWLHCGHRNQRLWGLLWKRVSSAHEGRSHLSQHVSTASWISTGLPSLPPIYLQSFGRRHVPAERPLRGRIEQQSTFWQSQDRGDWDHRRSYDSQMI